MEENQSAHKLQSANDGDGQLLIQSRRNGFSCGPTGDKNSDPCYKTRVKYKVDSPRASESGESAVRKQSSCSETDYGDNGVQSDLVRRTNISPVVKLSRSELLDQDNERCDADSHLLDRTNYDAASMRSSPARIPTTDQSALIIHTSDQSEVTSGPVRVEGAMNLRGEEGKSRSSYQLDDVTPVSEERPSCATRSQVMTFISLAVSTFLDQVSYSVLAPFFPREVSCQ